MCGVYDVKMKNQQINHYKISVKEKKSLCRGIDFDRSYTIQWQGGLRISLDGNIGNRIDITLNEENTFQLKKDLDKIVRRIKRDLRK